MNIGITGATGLIGRRVASLARSHGHDVIGFTHNRDRVSPGWRFFCDNQSPDVDGCDAILNLAGENVVGRWTARKKEAIRASRVQGTRGIVEAIRKAKTPPRVLVNGSATGIYGDTGDTPADETGAHGTGFLADVCEAWEREALAARDMGTRVVLLRTGIVLARDGGALAAMLPVFKLGLGGTLGDGRQWMSWIHIDDEAALALAAIERSAYDGPVNATAPEPARNADFTKALARALRRPALFRVPAAALRAAAGGFAAELLESRRITPAAAAKAAFPFKFPTLDAALRDLLGAR